MLHNNIRYISYISYRSVYKVRECIVIRFLRYTLFFEFWGSDIFQATDFWRFIQNIRFSRGENPDIAKNRPWEGVFPPFLACFAIFEHIFLMLKAMAKKAKSIVTLSL